MEGGRRCGDSWLGITGERVFGAVWFVCLMIVWSFGGIVCFSANDSGGLFILRSYSFDRGKM